MQDAAPDRGISGTPRSQTWQPVVAPVASCGRFLAHTVAGCALRGTLLLPLRQIHYRFTNLCNSSNIETLSEEIGIRSSLTIK